MINLNDFLFGFAVCALICSPFLTFFTLREISWYRTQQELKKISEDFAKSIEMPKELKEAEDILAEVDSLLKG